MRSKHFHFYNDACTAKLDVNENDNVAFILDCFTEYTC